MDILPASCHQYPLGVIPGWTLYWLDTSSTKWQLVNRMIDLQHAPGRHTADKVAELIVGLCDKWALRRSKDDPIMVTGDKATNMMKGVQQIPAA